LYDDDAADVGEVGAAALDSETSGLGLTAAVSSAKVSGIGAPGDDVSSIALQLAASGVEAAVEASMHNAVSL
jgi:hypothetical protein